MSIRIYERREADVVNDVTSCPICSRKYSLTDPKLEAKLLPCLDTFCTQCLEVHVHNLKTNYPWLTISCQLCQTPLEIPEGSLQKLKTNPVVAIHLKIAAITSDPADGKHICDACDGAIIEGRAQGSAPPAEVYCEECDQKLCRDCLCSHGKLKPTKSHRRVVRLGSEESRKLALELKDLLPRCANHKTRGSGELYCAICHMFICGACSVAHVRKHGSPCLKATALAEELRARVSADAGNVEKLQETSRSKRNTIAAQKAEFDDNFKSTKTLIEERARDLTEIIEQHKAELLQQLEKKRSEKEDAFVEAEEAARRNEHILARFGDFAALTNKLDLATINDLRPLVSQRAAGLMNATADSSVEPISVSFVPGLWQQTVLPRGEINCLGVIEIDTKLWPSERQTL